jgi:diguanylate cyclase (GGDEF)-like protein
VNYNDIAKDKLLEIISLQTEVVQQGLDLSGIMNLVTLRSQHLTKADGASIELIEQSELVYRSVSGMANRFLGLRLNIDKSLSGEAIQKRTPLISNDTESDDRVNKIACRQIGLNAMIVVPLIFGENVVGIIKVLSRETNAFEEEDAKVLQLLSGLIAAAMYNAMQNDENELIFLATHDNLTGIANRALFYDRLRQKLSKAAAKFERFGIISFDMDGLKDINDTYGHRAGDEAIKAVAARAQALLKNDGTVARIGGDEFGAIIAKDVDKRALQKLAKALELAIEAPFEFEDNLMPLKASIGTALFSEDGIALEILVEKADRAMYAAKRQRKGKDAR